MKGGNVSLTKIANTKLNKIVIEFGWDASVSEGDSFDIDLAAFVCGSDGKVRSDSDFVFFNNMTGADRTVKLKKNGFSLHLSQMSESINKIFLCLTIYDAEERKQNFRMLKKAFICVANKSDNKLLTKYELVTKMNLETTMLFAEVYRHRSDWKFRAIGQGFSENFFDVAKNYGVEV